MIGQPDREVSVAANDVEVNGIMSRTNTLEQAYEEGSRSWH